MRFTIKTDLRAGSASTGVQGIDGAASPRLRVLVPLALAMLAGCAVFWSAPALGKEVHVYKATFGGTGSGAGDLSGPHGIAVDDATGDVYVVDKNNGRVERFSATGEYEGQFNGSGSYEDLEELMPVKTSAAAPTGTLSGPVTIAVDNSSNPSDPSKGDVYVADSGHYVVDKFSAAGAYLGQLTGTPEGRNSKGEATGGPFMGELTSIAVAPSGALWVSLSDGFCGFSDAFENQFLSEFGTSFGGANIFGLAVDLEENLYFDDGETIVKVSKSGATLLGTRNTDGAFVRPFGGESDNYSYATEQSAVAVDPATGEVFIGRRNVQEPYEPTVGAFGLNGTPIERFGLGHLPEGYDSFGGIAVDASNGAVYVSDLEANDVEVFEALTLPSVSVAAPSERTTRSVTLKGTVNPEGKPVETCAFEYDTREYKEGEASHGTSVPCSPSAEDLGDGTAAVPVKAQLEGLTPETQYYYRLVAKNAAPESNFSEGREFFTGPKLGEEFATDVAAGSATLQVPIDPEGAGTEYRLEYGVSAAYEHSVGGSVGEGSESVPVDVHLQTLEPNASYHYRFVTVQDGEAFSGPDRTFTTQGATGESVLPDGRVWELVSPPDKDGALIEPFEDSGQIQAASDGNGIAYRTEGPAVGEDPVGDTEHSQVLSRRGVDGWSTVDLTLPGRLPEDGEPAEGLYDYKAEYQLFSPNLSLAIVEPKPAGTPLLSPEATERTLYLRDNLSASFVPLVTPANLPAGVEIEEENAENGSVHRAFEMKFVAASPDLSHVVLKTPAALTPEAIDEETIAHHDPSSNIQQNFYEWSGGQLRLINVLPDGQEAHGPFDKMPPVEFAGTSDTYAGGYGGAQRAMSNDGRRVAWTWGAYEEGQYRGLYVRDMVEEKTVKVGGAHAIYQTMNSEGSKIFYLENGDLYVYDFEAEAAIDLTATHGQGESSGGVQQAVSDVNENGSYVYFVATGVLAEGGVSGKDNLYLLHDTGTGWTTTYIATLAPQDSPTWYTTAFFGDGMDLSRVSSRVSPDGRYLAFMSSRPLTGYDNTDAVSGEPDEEVYLYDAQKNKLVCASCDPTGARPVGVFDSKDNLLLVDRNAIWAGLGGNSDEAGDARWLAGSIPGYDAVNTLFTYQPRYLSDSGRLFFNSPVGLVSQDTNGLEDVYEYEPEGIGNCDSSVSSTMIVYVREVAGRPVGGCVGVISSGTSSAESVFYDASENGGDVFFDTKSRLGGEDYDNSYDVYDAHVCTGEVPCKATPVSPPPCDSGDSCKVAPSPQPAIFGAPASATFSGAGNVTPTTPNPKTVTKNAIKCAKGKKPSHGRCLKRKKQAKIVDHDRRAKR